VKTFLIATNVRNTSQLPCDSFISKELPAIKGSYRVVGLLYTTLAWMHSKPPGADPIYPKFKRQLSLTQRYDKAEISLYFRQHMSYRCYFSITAPCDVPDCGHTAVCVHVGTTLCISPSVVIPYPSHT
jgi:hypothetical protein